ncbi:TonB-dependent receptor family protein [Bacteroidia bacterium]|nr:TonB-dependent receptor family protein [Bacteroidia bacterium]
MKYFYSLLLVFIGLGVLAQTTYPIGGKLKNGDTNEPIVGATVFAIRSDSTVAGGAISDDKGRFNLELPRGEYVIKINYLGLAPYNESLRVRRDDYLGTVIMSANTEKLEVVEVKRKAVQATVQGDTTSFNAKAYKTNQNASAKDLLEKMPGVQDDNGDIKAQGEKVQQVLVDGKQFFGQDPKTALATLPAEVVDKIQVFDDKSEQSKASGIDDGTRIKTINIVTKINMRNGEFGRMYGGVGTDDRYSSGASINMFRGERRLSLLGQINNINQQNFSTEDLLGVVGDNSGGGRGKRRGGRGPGGGRPSFLNGFSAGGSARDFSVSSVGGITKTIAGGANYQDKWGKKVDVSGSYFINQGENKAINNTYQLYYLGRTDGQEYDEVDSSNSTNLNHKFNAKLVYKVNQKMSFYYVPSLTIQQNEGSTLLNGSTIQESSALNALNQTFSSDLSAFKMSNNLMFRLNGEKRGRSLFVQLKNDVDRTDGDNQLNATNSNINNVIYNVDQIGDLDEDIDGWKTSVMYSEPWGNSGLGAFISYDFDNSRAALNQQTISGVIAPNVGTYDSSLSSLYNNDWNTHSAGLGIRKFGRKGGFVVRAKFEKAILNNDQSVPMEESVERTFNNFTPFALYRARLKNKASWFTMYRTYTSKPAASQLSETVDNSNTLQLSTGNSNLTQQYGHWFMSKYNSANVEKSTIFYAMVNGGLSKNYIGQNTFTASRDTIYNGITLYRGSQLVNPINIDGQYTANAFVTYGFPVSKIKSNLNLNLSTGIANIPSIINDVKANTFNQNYGLGLVISSNISEKIDFTISTESNFVVSSNSLNSSLNNEYLVQTSKIKYDWIMPLGLTFRTQLQHQEYFGLNDLLNNRVLLWTAGIGKQLFKNKRGEVQLSMYDMLGQNNNVAQNFYDSYYEETNSNVLTRYVMLSFSYNLRKFRESKVEE